jgi:hypothetical protein
MIIATLDPKRDAYQLMATYVAQELQPSGYEDERGQVTVYCEGQPTFTFATPNAACWQ